MEKYNEIPEEPPSSSETCGHCINNNRDIRDGRRRFMGLFDVCINREIPEPIPRTGRRNNYGFGYFILPPMV